MTPNEFHMLRNRAAAIPLITAAHLANKKPRTLIRGTTLQYQAFHVYLGADGQIHVVVYDKVPKKDFLVAHHAGPGGAELRRNSDYLPSKRAYPEFSDFEFCSLLAEQGEKPVFSEYSDSADGRRKDVTGGYSGITLEDPRACLADATLPAQVRGLPAVAPGTVDELVAARLVTQAARDLGVTQVRKGHLYVAVPQANAAEVLAKATEYLTSTPPLALYDTSIRDAVVDAVLGPDSDIKVRGDFDLDGGEVQVCLHTEGDPLKNAGESLCYIGDDDDRVPDAIVGEIMGRVFFAVKSDESVDVTFLEFGDKEKFLTTLLTRHGLKHRV